MVSESCSRIDYKHVPNTHALLFSGLFPFNFQKSSSPLKQSPSEQVRRRGGVPRGEDGAVPGDMVGELSTTLERSLVVIELASLVRQPQKSSVPSSANTSGTRNGLTNFKRFCKVGYLWQY